MHCGFTVVSDRKPIVGLGHPVTIGIHLSAEILLTRHPGQLKILSLVTNTSESEKPPKEPNIALPNRFCNPESFRGWNVKNATKNCNTFKFPNTLESFWAL